jgi:hypothetical protein
LLGKGAEESTYKKTIVGASVLLRRGGTSPTDLPLASYLAQLDAAGARLKLASWCSSCANGSGREDEEVGELHFELLRLR